jgi:uncharacterized protein YjiS (DUF1127 family)
MSSPASHLVATVFAAARAAAKATVAVVRTTWKNHRHRRAVRELLHFGDHALADIGLTRGDVVAALTGPLAEDPSTRLRILAVERRAARRAQARERLDTSTGRMPVETPALRARV